MRNEPTNRHPSNSALRRHLTRPHKLTQRHIAACSECNLAIKLMQASTQHASTYEFSDPLIAKLSSLPAMADGAPGGLLLARNTADSWQSRPLAAVRQSGHGVERRMRFQVAGVHIDLVVDKLGHQLECSLRISRRGCPLPGFVIAVNGRKLLPSDTGFFSWTATTLPAQIALWSTDRSFTTGDIKW